MNYHKIESNSNFDELVIKLPFATNENLVNYTFFIQFLELIDTFELVVTNFIILDPVILIHYNENEIPLRVRFSPNLNQNLFLKTENEIYNINSKIELSTNEYLITFLLNENLTFQREFQLICKIKKENNPSEIEEMKDIYIAIYTIMNKCVQYFSNLNYRNPLVEMEVYFPFSLNNVDIALSVNNNDYLFLKIPNTKQMNVFLYSYNYENLNKDVYGIKILPHTLYYENNNLFFYETLELYDPYLGIDTNSEFYYDIQIIHKNSEINSIYFVFNTTFNPTDIFKLYFTEMCYNNGKAIECYFTNYFPTNKYYITRFINCDKYNMYRIDLPSSFQILIKDEPTIKSISPNLIYQNDINNKIINIHAKYNGKKEIINTIEKIFLRKVHEDSISFNFDDIIIKDFVINDFNETIIIPITRLNIGLYKIYIIFRTSENLTMIEPGEIFYVSPYKYSTENFLYLNAPKIEYQMNFSFYDFEGDETIEIEEVVEEENKKTEELEDVIEEVEIKQLDDIEEEEVEEEKEELIEQEMILNKIDNNILYKMKYGIEETFFNNIVKNEITLYSIYEQYSISIECEDTQINDDNNYICSLINLNNEKILKENKPGYYYLIIGNDIVSTNFFLSKPLNQSQIIINIPKELYFNTNKITIKSDEFLLNE